MRVIGNYPNLMKKFFLWALATIFCCVAANAQTVGVAVLNHGNDKTLFYGNTALQQAVEAATDGDVISLSPGTFLAYEGGPYENQYFIKSGLTIIGSGMDEGPSQTIIKSFSMNAGGNPEKFIKLTLKNICITESFSIRSETGSYDLSLEKCKAAGFICNIDANQSCAIEMVNCENSSDRWNWDYFENTTLTAYNCYLQPLIKGDVTRSRVLSNCMFLATPQGTGAINNCIIVDEDGSAILDPGIRATNCKAIVDNSGFFGTQTLSNERLPKDFDAFVEGSFYELKPELTSTWVDENGEQIGIYGGPKPFSMLPDAPRFTKFNVPSRTDAEGKLPVDIEVAMPGK